jgi:hypothetical protein
MESVGCTRREQNRRALLIRTSSADYIKMTAHAFARYNSLSKNRFFIAIVGMSLIMFIPALGSFGIMDPSDGLYAEGAREMVESGNS